MQVLDEIVSLSDNILEDRHSAKSLLDKFIEDKGKVSEYIALKISELLQ